MTENPWLAVLTALFLWWFSTGIILLRVRMADNGDEDQHFFSVLMGTPLLLIGASAARTSMGDASVNGTYLAFFAAVALWGWIELAFLSGIITGPNRTPCPPFASQGDRFWRAVGTIAWHEALLLGMVVTLGIMSRGAENQFAFWTFALLFVARIFAKLNLFLGVPRINTQFLPRPLSHLTSHFRFARMNAFFPISVSALTVASALLLERTMTATEAGATIGFALLTSLCVLALLEHWFMVLPLPDEKLWRWMIPAAKSQSKDRLHEDTHGL